MQKFNEAGCIRYYVNLSFVAIGYQDGYQKNDVSHAMTKEAAIAEVIVKYLNEPYPLRGISVYECVLCA